MKSENCMLIASGLFAFAGYCFAKGIDRTPVSDPIVTALDQPEGIERDEAYINAYHKLAKNTYN